MAELLIKAIDAVHSDSTKDRRGCYKRGMPVVIMDDGHKWGKEEGLPNFIILKLPGIPKEKLEKYLTPEPGLSDTGDIIGDRRRMWKLRLEGMPIAARKKLQETGELIANWGQVKSYFRNLLTGLDETKEIT